MPKRVITDFKHYEPNESIYAPRERDLDNISLQIDSLLMRSNELVQLGVNSMGPFEKGDIRNVEAVDLSVSAHANESQSVR